MKKVWIYVRCSTTDKGQSTDSQLVWIQDYVAKNWWTVYKVYRDMLSWTKESRPWLDDLLADAKNKLFDVVLVFRFDRLSRSTKQLVSTLELFRKLWIDFVSINEQIDTSTITGQLMFTIISAFAQFEKEVLSSRVKAGLQNAVSKWKILGKPKKEADSDWIRLLRGQGLSIRDISKQTWYWRGLVCRVLSSKPS